LDNSAVLDIHRASDFPQVNGAVDALYEKFRALTQFARKKQHVLKRHIKLVVLNLYTTWLADPTRYVAYYRMKGMYLGHSRYNELYITYLTVAVVDALLELGLIEHEMGFYGRNERKGQSRTSRMRATDGLIDLIQGEHGMTADMIEWAPGYECIVLRDKLAGTKKPVDIDYEDTADTQRMRQELTDYNKLLARTKIGLSTERIGDHPPTGSPPKPDFTNKFVRRVFANGSWEHGGRFYGGWWQTLERAWRSQILIDGKPATELDYSGLHIVILYAMEGISYWVEIGRDPYELEGYERSGRMRDLLKLVLLIAINTDCELEAF
jgi:hypothetical protein